MMTPAAVYRRLLTYGTRHWPWFLVAAVGMAMHAASVAGLVVLVEPLIDGTFIKKDPTVIRWMPWVILAVFLARGIAGFLSTYTMEWIGRRVVTDLRQELFDQLLHLFPALPVYLSLALHPVWILTGTGFPCSHRLPI